MKKILLCLLFVATPSFAWVSGDNQSITSIMVWENSETTGVLHFQLSNGTWCYIPAGQKILQSLVLALYASGKKAEVFCYDEADSAAGGSVPAAHRLHRLMAK